METCKWIRYNGNNMYNTECGHIQGISVRPKQKKCFCGKIIERVNSDKFDSAERHFQEMVCDLK